MPKRRKVHGVLLAAPAWAHVGVTSSPASTRPTLSAMNWLSANDPATGYMWTPSGDTYVGLEP